MPRPRTRTVRTSPAPTRSLREFLATEIAGGVVLVASAAVALLWANSPWNASYDTVWQADIGVHVGRFGLALDARHWINDGLMTIFFLVVGLEVKRELIGGELRDRRRAALPVVAAVGGMVVPALLYLVLNPSGPESRGWGVPMATDIAFAIGVLALVAPRIPPAVRLFLLTLAIVDDIGAILVIALVYSSGIDGRWLGVAVVIVGAVAGLRRLRVSSIAAHVILGVLLWLAVHASGVHATLAGVAMALVPSGTPARRRSAQLDRLEHVLHRASSFVIVPVFALANAGVDLTGRGMNDAATSTVSIGIVVALVAGKTAGIAGASWAVTKAGLADLPSGVTWRQLTGAAALGGIGFTVSLFVTGLAFDDSALVDQAKVGILVASVAAGLIGAAILRSPALPHPTRHSPQQR